MTETVTQTQSGAAEVVDAATAAVASIGEPGLHESCDALVLFGASGDLAKKLVLPSLYRLVEDGLLDIPVVGVALTEWDDDGMRDYAEESLRNHGLDLKGDKVWRSMRRHLHFISGNYAEDETFEALAAKLAELKANFPLFYLAIPPSFFGQVVEQLAKHGLSTKCRVVVEKPFGRDLGSARALNAKLHEHLTEDQIFRMDHFLGKEPVQNLLMFRLANSMVEPIWNNKYIGNVQITMFEDFGVEDRGSFYDGVGTLRDVVQNHLMQIFCLLAMEPPADIDTDEIHDEQIKVLRATRPIDPADVVRGQYRRYQDTQGVAPGSDTETYVAMSLWVDSWRWAGVPFHIRAGKELPFTATEAVVTFRNAPRLLVGSKGLIAPPPNRVRFRFTQPDGVSIEMQAKKPGGGFKSGTVALRADFEKEFGREAEPYELLIGAALVGDHSLFGCADAVLRTWEIVQPVLDDPPNVDLYEEGSEGPHEAERLVEDCGGWLRPIDPATE